VITVLCITVLIAHDIRMVAKGAIPTVLHESNVFTLLFSIYSNVGLLGVGPGMVDMRAHGVSALVPFALIIALSALLFGLVAIGGLFKIGNILQARTTVLLIGCILLPVLFTFALGVVVHWRALPRHFIPLVPLFSLLYAFGLAWWWRRRLAGVAVVVIAAVMMSYSSLSIRYAARHAKDDYKHAAELAASELERGGRVWWVAEFRGLLYYGVPYVIDEPEWPQAQQSRKVQVVWERTFSFLSAQEPPTLVLLSRPETYDQQGVMSNYLSVNKYHLVASLPAFTVWRR